MTQQDILRGIITHCSSTTVRAARLLANPEKKIHGSKRDAVMWRLAKATLESSDAVKLPRDLKIALQDILDHEEAASSLKRNITVRFRCTEDERDRIQSLADRYTDGNISRWLVQQGTIEQ